MGCCVSSTNSHPHFPLSDSPANEEETVKEVLSETPISKPLSPLVIFQEKVEVEALVATAEEVCEVSEASEVCSEGFSTASFKEKNEIEVDSHDDEEVTQKVRRSPAKSRRRRPCSGDINTGGGKERGGWGPASRSEPLPECLNRAPSRTMRTSARRRNGFPTGESAGRSRSPAIVPEAGAARTGRGKAPPSITTGRCNPRPPATTPQKGCPFENSNAGESPTANETLENPLVSLECFIFL